jgi:signal transduction histidine kinase
MQLFSTWRQRSAAETTYLLTDVAGQLAVVIDRHRTLSQAAAHISQQQQRLVHTLHDSLGQQLTGIGLLSRSLSDRLKDSGGPITEVVREISQQAQASLELVRQLSRGLFPSEIDAEGLVSALHRLAATTSNLGAIRCRVEDTGRVHVRDNRVASELYRIAQEAVTNALKHANAQNVTVRLAVEAGTTILSVADDGRGVQMRPGSSGGMGLRIMRYRAQSIGASLTVESTPDVGTVITCLLRGKPQELTQPVRAR